MMGLRVVVVFLASVTFLRLATAASDCADELDVGDTVIAIEKHLTFEGCDHDQPYKVGGYIFVCRKYDYKYNYGDVVLILKDQNGKALLMVEEECFEGTVFKPQ